MDGGNVNTQTVTMEMSPAMSTATFFEDAWPSFGIFRAMVPCVFMDAPRSEETTAEFAFRVLG